jgi:hypothetical protein
MTIARTIGRNFMIITGELRRIITSAEAVKIKQNAVIRFIDPSCGIRLLKRAMLNIHPTRSSKLKNSIKETDIHIATCLTRGIPDENNFVFGICPDV